jgi:sterol 3beta-glucosyltransferase
VAEFLNAGPPPVYVGFSSMIPRDPESTIHLALRALQAAGTRGILGSGWMPPDLHDDLPEDVLVLDEIPHDWLFPRVAAVVHHGGAGTTGAAIRAGTPEVVVPFYADQPFWGARVTALGLGPPPIPEKSLTAEALAMAIGIAVNDESIRRRSREAGELLRAEDGVEAAVGIVDRTLAREL